MGKGIGNEYKEDNTLSHKLEYCYSVHLHVREKIWFFINVTKNVQALHGYFRFGVCQHQNESKTYYIYC